VRIILLVLSLLLAGCSQDKLNDTLATPQEKAAASSFIVALQSGRLETVKASVEPQLYAETRRLPANSSAYQSGQSPPGDRLRPYQFAERRLSDAEALNLSSVPPPNGR
jgi:hypothetical protein